MSTAWLKAPAANSSDHSPFVVTSSTNGCTSASNVATKELSVTLVRYADAETAGFTTTRVVTSTRSPGCTMHVGTLFGSERR
ncbi:MAG TPA: hypothetical protein VHK90_09180 [Thermoanaerobaculia bacterium]|nr:hypothetical protein [Thermoanaerobaculia bacterium]